MVPTRRQGVSGAVSWSSAEVHLSIPVLTALSSSHQLLAQGALGPLHGDNEEPEAQVGWWGRHEVQRDF